MFTLYIPKDDELCPEWQIIFQIAFPGEDNYYKIAIPESDIARIKNSNGWVEVNNHLFNLDKAEAFFFYTEYKGLDGKWLRYTKEGWDLVLKAELCKELSLNKDISDRHAISDGDSVGLSEAFKALGLRI